MKTALEALEALQAGNRRFTDGKPLQRLRDTASRREELLDGQSPFAIVLGCSDSRVPAEIVFDQGLGDLFVIRVAGNVVAPSQIGSIEFAAEFFKTPLVVVLGHSQCSAVQVTLDRHRGGLEAKSENLDAIVERIWPGIQSLLDSPQVHDNEQLMPAAVKANITASVEQLRYGSPFLENLVQSGKLLITGAEYSLESGKVEFLGQH